MGRPISFDRDEAVRIAMNEFWADGYNANSVKALSETLGITRSSFYNAFESRRAIFEEALERYSRESPDHVLAKAGDNTPILPLLNRLFKEVCRVRARDPEARGCMAVNCLAETGGANQEIDDLLETKFEAGIDMFERLLRIAAKRGEIPRSTNFRKKALALKALLVGLNMLAKVVRDEKELMSIVSQTLPGLGLSPAGGKSRSATP
jgi:TetR/AcrR family transcriptional regulator, transcriptional repressor for nem operon